MIKRIYVPMKFGVNIEGADLGALKINEYLNDGNESIVNFSGKLDLQEKLKNLDSIINMAENTAFVVNKVLELNNFPLTIGGDHSIALGTLSSIASKYENLGVFWIDAHADLNTENTTPSGNIHGMILASLLGFGHEKMINIYKKQVKLKKDNVILYGCRDLDHGEQELISKYQILKYDYSTIKNNFICSLNDAIKKMKSKTDTVHISFDVDSLNPIIAPGVSTPVISGFSVNQIKKVIKTIFDNFKVVSMDIVEYNPLKDIDNKTFKIVIEIIDFVNKHCK